MFHFIDYSLPKYDNDNFRVTGSSKHELIIKPTLLIGGGNG